ncbi:MAG: hypothetical protein M3N43_05290, partial [Actinomycetota bacterium]|nr:hypothetical protein [Actinomycetota bacterium]
SWGLDEDGNGTLIGVRAAKDVLILRPHIHDNGTASSNEPGCNAITASGVDDANLPAQRVWIVDGTFYRNRGDHVRIGRPTAGGGADIPAFIYIARNLMWEDPSRPDNAIGENATDIKLSADVVFSQNVAYGFRSTPTSPGECVVVHDNATRVWILDNDLSACQTGAAVTSGTVVRILGNFIHDTTQRAIRATPNVTSAHNTIRRSPIGIYSSSNPGTVLGNILHETPTPYSFSGGGSVAQNMTTGDPLFVNAASDTLQASSPAKDAASEGSAYAEFQTLYGINIRNGRPAGVTWDQGSYEIPSGGGPPNAPGPPSIQVEVVP